MVLIYNYLVEDRHDPYRYWICKNEKEVIDVAQEYYEHLFEDEIEGEFKDDPHYPTTFEMAKDFLECNDRPVTKLEEEHDAEIAQKLAEHRYSELKEYFSHGWENIHTEEELREKVSDSTKLDNTSVSDVGGGYIVCDFDYAEVSGTISVDNEGKFELADVIDVWMPDLETPFSFEMDENGKATLINY